MNLSKLARQDENSIEIKVFAISADKLLTAEHEQQDEAGWQVVELK